MSAKNKFRPMDLVRNQQGELFLVDEEKPEWSGCYWAVSLSRPEMGVLDVYDEHDRRLVSVEELPDAVRALLMAKNALSRTSGGSMGTFLSTIIRVIDELQGILDSESPE
jgi:hypothetical protein